MRRAAPKTPLGPICIPREAFTPAGNASRPQIRRAGETHHHSLSPLPTVRRGRKSPPSRPRTGDEVDWKVKHTPHFPHAPKWFSFSLWPMKVEVGLIFLGRLFFRVRAWIPPPFFASLFSGLLLRLAMDGGRKRSWASFYPLQSLLSLSLKAPFVDGDDEEKTVFPAVH